VCNLTIKKNESHDIEILNNISIYNNENIISDSKIVEIAFSNENNNIKCKIILEKNCTKFLFILKNITDFDFQLIPRSVNTYVMSCKLFRLIGDYFYLSLDPDDRYLNSISDEDGLVIIAKELERTIIPPVANRNVSKSYP